MTARICEFQTEGADCPGPAHKLAAKGWRQERHALTNPDWDRFVITQPALAEALRPFLKTSLADGALPVAQKELIVVALLAAQGYEAGVRSHADRALAAGATAEELREALALLIPFAGIGRYLRAAAWIEAAVDAQASD